MADQSLGVAAMNSKMIAPCGMNCAICLGHQREKNRCPGCNYENLNKIAHHSKCTIRKCMNLKASRFCFTCDKFPCRRMRQLDKRYRTRYGMSMIENLENIQEDGIRKFVANEKLRWKCPKCGGILCVHRDSCLKCGKKR